MPHVAASSNHAKKKTKRAEAQQREDVKAARQQFEDERKTLQAADVMALDAMGGVTGMSRRDGYAPCGARAVSYEPAGKGTRLSLIGALSVDGLLGGLEVTGSINGDVCEALIEQVVVPHLRPGKVVLLDHIPFHHRESIRELVETQGATLKFLPASSPEFNPIEACWSKLKAWLRRKAARTVPALQEAITEAIHQVTRSDAEGWFRHAGYQFNSNE